MAHSPNPRFIQIPVAILLSLFHQYKDHQGRPPNMDLLLNSHRQQDTAQVLRSHDLHRFWYIRPKYGLGRLIRLEAQTLYDFI